MESVSLQRSEGIIRARVSINIGLLKERLSLRLNAYGCVCIVELGLFIATT